MILNANFYDFDPIESVSQR